MWANLDSAANNKPTEDRTELSRSNGSQYFSKRIQNREAHLEPAGSQPARPAKVSDTLVVNLALLEEDPSVVSKSTGFLNCVSLLQLSIHIINGRYKTTHIGTAEPMTRLLQFHTFSGIGAIPGKLRGLHICGV
ncbi:hypothetical protein EYF80_003547 [Liparis tanakae]|uniref:Uncharacterized protein n=1 Tax=Liparis tanakae TaxID=230148 RepID=A0A4Z2J7R9_9TELE|nr:hypothetical protein EYF80_003547 [Liparis tanakae]